MILYINKFIDFIGSKKQFYRLLSNYNVINENISISANNIHIDAEFITNISKYKFLSSILNRIVDKNILHLQMECTFDSSLNQIKFKTRPKKVHYFDCYGTFYCDDEYNILSHDIQIQFNDNFKSAKMFEGKIKENIIKQIDSDIIELKKLINQ